MEATKTTKTLQKILTSSYEALGKKKDSSYQDVIIEELMKDMLTMAAKARKETML